MSFKQTQHHRQYNISLKSSNGNTVGFINLSGQFLRAVVGKREDMITVADIENINDGDLQSYLSNLTIEVSGIELDKEPIKISEY